MRVLQVGRYFPPHVGGVETLVFNLAEGLNGHGIRCDVLCSNKENLYKEDKISDYYVYRTKSHGQLMSLSITPQLVSKFREIAGNYDIIHLHHPDPIATFALYLVNPKCKVVVHWHSDIIRQKIPLVFFKPLQNWMLRRADVIITTSPHYAMGSTHLAPFKDKIAVIPIGIKPLDGVPGESELLAKRIEFGERKIIFSLGRLVYYKGFEHLIDAASYLDDSYLILIGGTGPLERALSNRIAKKNLTQRIRLLGEIHPSELATYYRLARIFCLPSTFRTEAFGIVLLEAMSMGKPLITTDLPDSGISWVNQNNITGLTVPPGNALDLACAIKRIGVDGNLQKKFSTASKARFLAKFTCGQMLASTIELYSTITA